MNLLIGLSDGSIFYMNFANWFDDIHNNSSLNDVALNMTEKESSKPIIKRIRDNDGNAITQLVIDHMQQKVYGIREKLGILRCPTLHSCNKNTTLLMTNSQNFIQSIAVDSWNGYVFNLRKFI